MGDEPFGVGGIAGESAAQMVVDAAGGHGIEGPGGEVGGPITLGAVTKPEGLAEGHVDERRLREFRRATEAAPLRVESTGQLLDGRGEEVGRTFPVDGVEQRRRTGTGFDHRSGGDGAGQLVGLLLDLGPAVGPDVAQGVEHRGERRASLVVGRREVRAPVERASVRGQEDAHGPAARTGHGLDGLHVDGVDVGPFLTVDLDAHEAVVEPGRHHRVLERFVGHDMAPVAGRVADGQEDGLVLLGGPGERLGAPGIPVDRIGGVLAQIGGRLGGQAVGRGHVVRVSGGRTGAPIRHRHVSA